ncbi:MAG TPA: cytochrome c oxidase subunit 3 family protein [Clostridia bacterium]|nr:cytochrome c oxidase subunit 3 family protein [Clostridia bacterium]
MEQQRETAAFGMWLFLVTEIMFFGGMFCAYLVYRVSYFDAFVAGSQKMNITLGALNTAVLICSSVTMVLGVHAAKTNRRRATVLFLLLTIMLGLVFLGIKAVEYHEHWIAGEFPGPNFHFDGPDPRHTQLFFSLYFAMTGLHALHMIIGICVVGTIAYFAWKGHYSSEFHTPVEITGLYWHFVDVVWIYLFPLLYLISHKH